MQKMHNTPGDEKPPLWQFHESPQYQRDAKQWAKKRTVAFDAMKANALVWITHLRLGGSSLKPEPLYGFLHNEGLGVWAIDQKGVPQKTAESRLYTYADPKTHLLHLICIGDKQSQSGDVQYAKNYAKALQQGK